MTHEKLYKELQDQRIIKLLKMCDATEKTEALKLKEAGDKDYVNVPIEFLDKMQPHQDLYHLSIKQTAEDLLDKYDFFPKGEAPLNKLDFMHLRNIMYGQIPMGKVSETEYEISKGVRKFLAFLDEFIQKTP